MLWKGAHKVAQFIKRFLRHLTCLDHFCESCASAVEVQVLLTFPPDSDVSGTAFLCVLATPQYVCHIQEDSPSSTFAVRLVKIQLQCNSQMRFRCQTLCTHLVCEVAKHLASLLRHELLLHRQCQGITEV
jgi:hypothetical protein